MRRALWITVAISACLATAAVASATSFHTPSENIRCSVAKYGVRCDTTEHSWSPPPKPSSCEFDWGGSLGLNKKGRGHFLCVSDAVEPGGVLDYGHSLSRGRFRCTSLSSGVRCINKRNDHGFKVSREKVRRF